eukprot:5907813-Prymnesium_polylepis.1
MCVEALRFRAMRVASGGSSRGSSRWRFMDVELQLFRRRCRDGVIETVNLSAHHSTATDEGSQRARCALAALPKQRR